MPATGGFEGSNGLGGVHWTHLRFCKREGHVWRRALVEPWASLEATGRGGLERERCLAYAVVVVPVASTGQATKALGLQEICESS